jgi:hypothetical protein
VTAAGLAAFALSPEGTVYRQTCEFWGVDPAKDIGDDVLAADFRTALILTRPKEEPVDDRPGIVTNLEDEMREIARQAGL